MWGKTDFYFENTNILLKDVDLILIKKKVRFLFFLKCRSDFLIKNRPNFYMEKMQIRFFY